MAWVSDLRDRSFIGTESRLDTIFELLRQLVYGADADPAERLADLERRRTQIDAEIALPPDRVDPASIDFASRYGLRRRPRYVRLRLLTTVPVFPPEVTELELRADELAQVPLPVRTVFVIENKASYLAFPPVPNAIAIFGEGFGVTTLEKVPWLSERELIYRGDIDTHGFAILHRLRERVPSVRSILMDRETLLAHREQLVVEPSPTNAPLPRLTDSEAALYKDLVEDQFGTAVRLEQERVRFSRVERALEPWMDAT